MLQHSDCIRLHFFRAALSELLGLIFKFINQKAVLFLISLCILNKNG